MITSIKVRAPSSTANLGPGFDVFGLALDAFHDEIILGKKIPKVVEVDERSEILNESQNVALKKAINSEVFLIHGPPGTGKTTTLAEVIKKQKNQF